MVYHIYKHRIVLPIQGFGFIGKQADPSLQEGRAMPERRESVPLGEIHVSLPPSSAGVQESLFHWDIF